MGELLGYSLNGYVQAVKMRTLPTFLVEGRFDKIFIRQMIFEKNASNVGPVIVTVDSADNINASKIGNRIIVERVHRRVSDPLRLACLVDREYRCFVKDFPFSDLLTGHRIKNQSLFWTNGHSIENYTIQLDSIYDQLTTIYDSVDDVILARVGRNYEYLLIVSAALSLACYLHSALDRTQGHFPNEVWIQNANDLNLNSDALLAHLLTRGVAESTARLIVDETDEISEKFISSIETPNVLPLIHGHVGYALLWSGIAQAFTAVCEGGADDVASGHKRMKLKLAARLCIRKWSNAAEVPPWLDWINSYLPKTN